MVRPGWVLFVTSAAVEDESGAPDQMSFGFKVGDRFEAMEEENACDGGVRWNTVNTHHFVAGERPTFRVEGGAADHILRGIMEGYYAKV